MKSAFFKILAILLLLMVCVKYAFYPSPKLLKEPEAEYHLSIPHPSPEALAPGPDGYYWGVTEKDSEKPGYLYKMKADGSEWKVVHTFMKQDHDRIGVEPVAGLVSDGVDSMLGTITRSPHGSGFGTLYKINCATGVLTTLVEFTGIDGRHKGSYPQATLVNDGQGSFWGSTAYGGTHNRGTIFKFHPEKGDLITVSEMPLPPVPEYQWGGCRDALAKDGEGYWWGTTRSGGTDDCGTVFKVNAATGELAIVVEFTEGKGGTHPDAGLVGDGRGFLWGTCGRGALRYGTVFKVNAMTGALTTMAQFTGKDGSTPGQAPEAALVSDGHGFLWGSTFTGGKDDAGTLFKIEIATGSLTTVVEFERNVSHDKGFGPSSPLVRDGQGGFFGTTGQGGENDAGTAFRIDIRTGVLTTLVEFGRMGT